VTQLQREIFADLFNQTNSIFHEANWKLDPGENITYTLTDLTIESFYDYTSFYDFNFTITEDGLEPYLSYGYTIPPSDPINATGDNGATWDIMSEQIGLDNLIQVYFSFENTSTIDFYNYSYDQIGLNVQYSSNLNLPLDTQFTLEFYNTSSMSFDVISNTTYSVTDTAIEFLTPSNIMDFVDPTKDYQSIFKLTFTSESTQILSLEQVNVEFFDRDLGTIMLNPARVAYSTYTGHNTYFIDSNPIPSVSDPAPILSATAELEHYNSTPGMLNSYNLTIVNVGDLRADDVNITLKAPGIIENAGNFSLINGYLYYSLPKIDVGVQIQNLTFSFYTPNSNNLPLADIDYNHPIAIMNATHPDFITHTNDLFLSAPIDYSDAAHSPFLYMLQFSYESNYSNANLPFGLAPEVGDIIRVDLIVENLSPITLSNLNVTIPDYVVGFDRLDNITAEFLDIQFGGSSSQSFSTDINKTFWDSILFPGVDLFNSSQKYMIQIARKCPLVLGYRHFEIQKSFSDFDATTNSIVTVQINVTNTGNLYAYDINVHDFAGYPKVGFSLTSGTPDKYVASLAPSETFIYTYTLKFNKQGTYEITPATLEYDYISQQTAYSEPFTVKVRNYWFVNALYVVIPSIVGGIATGLLYRTKKRYDLEAAEFSRREELMFGQDLRSVSWNKRTLQEDLFDFNNPDTTQSKEGKKNEV
ncbi:MAG: BatD family protein, partial [Promethearchaeota archaeon]